MKKIGAISLALLIMMSTMGLTFTTHHCGDFIHNKSLSLGIEDLRCGMEEAFLSEISDNFINSNCCKNEFQDYKITDKFQLSTQEIAIDLQFVIAFFDTYVQVILIEKEQTSKYLNYHPPLPDRDIPVLLQSFLI